MYAITLTRLVSNKYKQTAQIWPDYQNHNIGGEHINKFEESYEINVG